MYWPNVYDSCFLGLHLGLIRFVNQDDTSKEISRKTGNQGYIHKSNLPVQKIMNVPSTFKYAGVKKAIDGNIHVYFVL